MHSISVSVRLVALLAVAIVAVLAFASFSPGTQRESAQAASGMITLPASVICTDFTLGTAGRVATSISRIEPTGPNEYDITTDLYIGPDQKPNDEGSALADLVPDFPPTVNTCQVDSTAAETNPEAGQMNAGQLYEGVSNHRPTTKVPATITKVGVGDFHLIYSSCAFDEVNKQWFRIDTDLALGATAPVPGDKRIGVATLFLGTDAPIDTKDVDGDTKPDVALDASQCTLSSAISFNTDMDTHWRQPTTDHPEIRGNQAVVIELDEATATDGSEATLTVVRTDDDLITDGVSEWSIHDAALSATDNDYNRIAVKILKGKIAKISFVCTKTGDTASADITQPGPDVVQQAGNDAVVEFKGQDAITNAPDVYDIWSVSFKKECFGGADNPVIVLVADKVGDNPTGPLIKSATGRNSRTWVYEFFDPAAAGSAKTLNRIEVDISKITKDIVVQQIQFDCGINNVLQKSAGAAVTKNANGSYSITQKFGTDAVLKATKNNAQGTGQHIEVWSATFNNKCYGGSDNPIRVTVSGSVNNAPPDGKLQIKQAFGTNTLPGALITGLQLDLDGPQPKEKDVPQDPDGTGEAPSSFVADDWDGDGCPDWDELDPWFINGRDPFNPNDCNIDDFTGSFSAIATIQAATEGTGGSYFHSIIAIQHNTTTNALTGALQVYLDSELLSGLGPTTTVPTKADGNPGAPPPPPFTVAAPTVVVGEFDKAKQLLIFDFCVEDIGGLFAPNVVAHVEVDAHSLKGTVDISGQQTQAACDSLTRNTTSGIQLPGVELVLVRQGVNQNYDKDKCTDMEELLGTGPATCGDDPYNPHDSDENFSSVGNLLVTVLDGTGAGGADWDKTLGQIIPGSYFNCISDIQHDKDTNALQANVFCYIDSTTTEINPEAYPGAFGDGIAGAGPPFPATPALPGGIWGDVSDNQTKLTGEYDPADHHLHLRGCFADKDGFGALGNIYVDATFDSGTGQGTVEIQILIDTVANCQAGPPFTTGGAFPTAKIEIVEQANKNGNGAGYDTDRDGCSDKEELGGNQVFGGLRDPYKYWDFYDVDQNRAIALGDFLGVLQRFGSAGDRYVNPLSDPPAPPAYHTRFDRGGAQSGANGWNLLPPDGQIALGDFLSMLRQFGHVCSPGPNDGAYPYPVT